MMKSDLEIETFYDSATHTLTYVAFDPETRDAVVIDPVLDYDPLTSSTSTASVDRVEAFLKKAKLRLRFVLETHAHADHLSGSQLLKERFDAPLVIGAAITEVQDVFAKVFDFGPSFARDGSQFDKLVRDNERFSAGSLAIEVIATPGHTPACVTYKIGNDAIFSGDALFVEDGGTGRCDFPRGSADALYTSVHDRLYALPNATRVFVGHDYPPSGGAYRSETTIGRSKESNVLLRATTSREAFVKRRHERDASLTPPRLLYPSIQVNIDGGRLPPAHANGARYLVIPLTSHGRA